MHVGEVNKRDRTSNYCFLIIGKWPTINVSLEHIHTIIMWWNAWTSQTHLRFVCVVRLMANGIDGVASIAIQRWMNGKSMTITPWDASIGRPNPDRGSSMWFCTVNFIAIFNVHKNGKNPYVVNESIEYLNRRNDLQVDGVQATQWSTAKTDWEFYYVIAATRERFNLQTSHLNLRWGVCSRTITRMRWWIALRHRHIAVQNRPSVDAHDIQLRHLIFFDFHF